MVSGGVGVVISSSKDLASTIPSGLYVLASQMARLIASESPACNASEASLYFSSRAIFALPAGSSSAHSCAACLPASSLSKNKTTSS